MKEILAHNGRQIRILIVLQGSHYLIVKTKATLIYLFVISHHVVAQEFEQLKLKFLKAYYDSAYSEAIESFNALEESYPKFPDKDDYFAVSRCYLFVQDQSRCYSMLQKSIENG